MSFKEWIYAELINDGIISPDEVSVEELDADYLYECTDLEEADFVNYECQFKEYCHRRGEIANLDFCYA